MPDSGYSWLLSGLMVMARILPCLMLSQAFFFSTVKGKIRAALVFTLSCYFLPQVHGQWHHGSESMTALLLKEMLAGSLLGLLIAMPFWLYSAIGALIDNQRGTLMGGQINPFLGVDITVFGQLLQQIMILLLILGPGFPMLLRIISLSYQYWPIADGLPFLGFSGWQAYQKLLQETFRYMVLFAAPVVSLLLLVDFCFAMVSVYSPQLQVTLLAIPLKCVLGILFLLIYFPFLYELALQRLLALPALPLQFAAEP